MPSKQVDSHEVVSRFRERGKSALIFYAPGFRAVWRAIMYSNAHFYLV